jgi:transposase
MSDLTHPSRVALMQMAASRICSLRFFPCEDRLLTTNLVRMTAPKETLPSVALRMEAGRMLLAGKAVRSIAKELGLSPQTVKRYQLLIEKNGPDVLEQMGVGGRKSALDAEARTWIVAELQGSPATHGFDSDQWTDSRLQTVIEQRFGIHFSRVYARQLMIDLGFSDRLKARHQKAQSTSSRVLNSEALSWIAAALRHSPKAEGFPADKWTNERLRTAIELRFGVRYSRTHVWKITTELGLSHLLSKARK